MYEDYTTITTFHIDYDKAYGYKIGQSQEDVKLPPDAENPPILSGFQPGKFWGVLSTSESGESFFGPYTTQAAAQAFIDEKLPEGRLFHMEQV